MTQSCCRSCHAPLEKTFCDLGLSPPSNSYLKKQDQSESVFPLHAYVCSNCLLVQLGQFQTPDEIFSDYQYFSSYSKSWLQHAHNYVEGIIQRLQLTPDHFVVEIASNDGYLLQFFQKHQIPHLGIEPAQNVARAAREKGIPTLSQFFGRKTALDLIAEGKRPHLLIGNNVLAHVPDLNDFVAGLATLLHPKGVITLEFPHLLCLIQENQFDTIYHEHFSYFSLLSVEKVFERHGLELFDVEELPTHGGSLRVYLQLKGGPQVPSSHIQALRAKEKNAGLDQLELYLHFQPKVDQIREQLRTFLTDLKQKGKTVAGYGAPAKGNTLLNYCGIDPSLLPFTVDLSPYKQGHFLPGSRIPIFAPQALFSSRPDYLLILPWNLKTEILQQMASIRNWGGQFVLPIPHLAIES